VRRTTERAPCYRNFGGTVHGSSGRLQQSSLELVKLIF
jgi:hypothetical protein